MADTDQVNKINTKNSTEENTKSDSTEITPFAHARDELFTNAKKTMGNVKKVEIKAELVEAGELLDLAITSGASDIHLSEGSPIMLRLSGSLVQVGGVIELSKEQVEHIIFSMMGPHEKELVLKQKDLDLSYEHVDGNVFRMNVFYKRGKLAGVFRLIPSNIKSFDKLGLPKICKKFLKQKQGLVLVTGPTGSGKSTTLSSMIDWLNHNKKYHIVTIEDPIEFIFKSDKCVFSQRELHSDTHTISNALKSVLRQDPDVVVISEMRDPETIATALNICETGHLVFGTLHTSGAAQTVSRIATAFPPVQQSQILNRLADSLVGVISQRLVLKIGGGRVPIFETFFNTPAFAHLIRSGDTVQLKNAIATGGKMGMFTMEKYAEDLVKQEIIGPEEVDWLLDEDCRKE